MRLIKNREIIEDHWVHIADDPIPLEGCISVSTARWKAEREDLLARDGELGLRISPEDPIEDFAGDLKHFQLIGLEFPTFTDGRLFSVAAMLRRHYHYKGEIRALGGFIRDQIFFLSRVGVNSFEMKDTSDLEEALSALDDFSVRYQTASDNG
ncbi:MAG: DUF934 domain-containing protein [Methylococcaceae bacterium]|nr:DUF934 domain-containing protein [Methylococcaceae bacterium]MCI0668741.1 DUF934 domain-containing protein [Methylococcaceae bacterium]MCI0733724.1 DUF934 domain-containing protein [Methylococcaceae bacterium]